MGSIDNEALANPGVRNIAVAGPATADKAGIVEEWKAQGDASRWMTVSIPHFNGEDSPVSSNDAEEALINQVVCQMDLAKSPRTSFRSSMAPARALDIATAASAVGFVGLGIYLVWLAGQLPSQRPPVVLCALALIVWLACIAFGVYRLARSNFLGRLVRRIRRKSDGIAAENAEDGSPIERAMGELVYLFDTNDFDYVVLEGLDTYRYLPLFERLRALNALANSHRTGKREPLRFIYLVSDGVIADPHERAAFFDHIVPAIPFVESSDVAAQFEDALAEAGIEIDGEFLADLSLFIDDPNILRDIVSESRYYKERLLGGDTEPGDVERLVSLLAYKALFPRDFELLQNDRGYVNALLLSRETIVEELRARNIQASSGLAAELARAEDEGDEARSRELAAELDNIKRADLEFARMPLSALVGTMADADPFYLNPPQREGLDPAHLKSVTESPYFPFIRFAVGGGWIDATYGRFLSDFYAESLSADDRALIAAIVQGAPTDEDRSVRNPFGVVARLDADSFSLGSARVFALFTHLIANGPNDKLRALLDGLEHDGDIAWLARYADSEHFDAAGLEVAEDLLERPIERIVENDGIDADARRRFCHVILARAQRTLSTGGVRDAVLSFALGDARFLAVERLDPLSIAAGLESIGYRAREIETAGCDQELLQYVYDHDLYEVSAPVVDRLVASLLGTGSAIERGFLVTRIHSLTGTAVRENVEREADAFLSTLLDASPVKLADSPEAVAWILNAKSVEPTRALAYIYALADEVVVERLAGVEDATYQGALIDRGLVACTPENILDYFAASSFAVDSHLATLLGENCFPNDFTMVTAQEYLGDESGFLKAVIACEELSDEKVGEISADYRAQFNRFDVSGISDARAALLIENGTIRMTAENLRFVREHNPGAAARFALVEPKAYLRAVLPAPDGSAAPCGFSADEALSAFAMADVDDSVKSTLLAQFNDPIALSASYSNEINSAIAARHFDPGDLWIAGELYAKGNRKLKRALAEAAALHCERVIAGGIVFSMEMAADIAWRLRADRARMLAFIAAELHGQTASPARLELRDLFERAGLEEYVALIDGPSALIPDTPEDDGLIDALDVLGMAGKQVGGTDARGLRRVNSKGYSRK